MRELLSADVIQAIDGEFTTTLAEYWLFYGSDHLPYLDAFDQYIESVTLILKRHFDRHDDVNNVDDLKKYLDAKIQWFTHPTSPWFIGRFPFPTPSVPPLLYKWLEVISLSIEEVSLYNARVSARVSSTIDGRA